MVPLLDLMNSSTKLSNSDMDTETKEEFSTPPFESYVSNEIISSSGIGFPQIFPIFTSMESQEDDLFLAGVNDEPVNYIGGLGVPMDDIYALELAGIGGTQIPLAEFPDFCEPSGDFRIGTRDPNGNNNPTKPETFFDDIPDDVLDHFETPPSPPSSSEL